MQQQFHQHHHHSALEIKEKLLQALDQDYNVVDMATALEVVSLLEKTAVTKEALETTRLGKLVNEMRKKTANEILARRAKDLVRRWRDMVAKPAENGIGGTGQGPGPVKLRTSLSSPATLTMGAMVATSPSVGSAVRSGLSIPPNSPCAAMRVVGGSPPTLQPPQRGVSGARLPSSVISPSNSVASNASRGSSSTSPGLSFSVSVPSQPTHSNSSRPSTPSSLQMVAKSKALSPGPGRPLVEQASSQRGIKRSREEHHGEETMTGFETCVTEKKTKSSNGTGPPDWPWTVDEGSRDSRDSRGSWSGDSSRLPHGTGSESRSRGRSSRARIAEYTSVKSPAPSDLLKEKFASIARAPKVKTTQELLEDLARRSGSPTIATRTETRPIPVAGSPDVRPWQDEAKDELMAKFLQSQTVEPSSKPNHRPTAVRTKIDDTVADILAKLPPLDPSLAVEVAQWTEQTEEDQVDSAESPVIHPSVTEEDVDRLHTTPLDNINGYQDFKQEFHEWHETLSVSTYNGDLLHLLPYVVIE